MLRLSFPLGRIMGVDLRLHASFLVLLAGAIAYGQAASGSAMRGLGLWAALMFAVLVREAARSIAGAYIGLHLRALFLLPVGGVMVFAPQEAGAERSMRPVMLAAPIANFSVGLLILGLSYSCAPGVNLLAQPWISPGHVLRSFVWMQFVLGVVNLLPAATLPTRQVLRDAAKNTGAKTAASKAVSTARAAGPAFGLMTGLAIAMLLAGIVTQNLWLIMLGGFALLTSQLQSPAVANGAGAENIRVEDIMLTEFTMLSSSDTLRGALSQTLHSVQDVFPVVRGDRLVGAVTRQAIAEHLQLEGDSYVQGLMTKSLQIAEPREQLMEALQRASAQGASEFVPVAENGRLLGILVPQHWSRAVHQVRQTRPPVEPRQPR
ncbi:MAG: CBS domain-containing protein [Acidobacteriaceae bacterium]